MNFVSTLKGEAILNSFAAFDWELLHMVLKERNTNHTDDSCSFLHMVLKYFTFISCCCMFQIIILLNSFLIGLGKIFILGVQRSLLTPRVLLGFVFVCVCAGAVGQDLTGGCICPHINFVGRKISFITRVIWTDFLHFLPTKI